MIIIADSGSTKTDWVLVNKKKEVSVVQTTGLNPFFVSQEDVKNILEKELYPYIDNREAEQVYFYGAGCADDSRKTLLQNALDDFFFRASVDIESDVLGAARALCGNNAGIVALLGTGSSSCYYDGSGIAYRQNSLGYILGDEGSGAYIGKKILTTFLYGTMPENLADSFHQKHKSNLPEILDCVYKHSFPNRFLASFTKFAFENRDNHFIKTLVLDCFNDFFTTQINFYKETGNTPLFFCGSIALVFAEELKQTAEKYNLTINKIEKSPMQGLLYFHKPYDELLTLKNN